MGIIRTKTVGLNEYEEFKEWTLKRSITYGPFPTRRKGFSLGINLLPPEYKLCNFNCIYCQCGWSKYTYEDIRKMGYDFPSLSDIYSEVEQTFRNIEKRFLARPNNIVISGNGEPTLYPQFLNAVSIIIELRNRFLPDIPVSVLSDGTRLHSEEVIRGLNKIEERVIKLDAGSDQLLRKICIPREKFSIDYLIKYIRKLNDFIIQCCFIDGIVSNITPENVKQWISLLTILKPKSVQIYSLDRIPPAPGLKKVSREKLEEIAEKTKKESGIDVAVF
ncbi:MAG: radical SAM protein [Planctomycetota bacterium]